MAIDHPESTLRTGSIADELATATGPLQVVVVSPARPIFEGTATHLVVPAANGQLGIWPRHADLVAALGVGRLRITEKPGAEHKFAVWGGFLKVGQGKVTILVDRAESSDDVDKAAAQSELDEVLAGLRHPQTDEEYAELLDRRKWCQVRLKIA